jgi:hypothetical protein
MRGMIYVLFFMFLIPFYGNGQTIRDDGKITKREKRFVQRKLYGSTRKIKVQEWKDAKKQRSAERKAESRNKRRSKRISANKKNWGTPKSRKEHAKHYKAMKKGWFARENPKRYVKETGYP